MNLERAIRLARTWAFGGVCSLQEGEAQEYHKLALAALESQRDGTAPVVRCGESKHYEPCEGGKDFCCIHHIGVGKDDFCSYGEKDGDGNGT